jgi:CRISPR-associated endonuclease/helicase Cas3
MLWLPNVEGAFLCTVGIVPHYAHSLDGRPLEEWQLLEDHLRQTAALAEGFASPFAPGWGRLVGLWHDVGKYRKAFQNRIGAGDGRAHIESSVDHKTAGALIAAQRSVTLLSFAIAGHHGGMPNRGDLEGALKDREHLLDEACRDGLPSSLVSQLLPDYPAWLKQTSSAGLSSWVRFIFSALVDADFLDTEKFYEKHYGRATVRPCLADLSASLDEYIDRKARNSQPSPINSMREYVLAACRRAATDSSGLFTLTVPTGGGKTLSSLSFALRHAVRHSKSRVIVVIPYTSIIEQTASVYREAFGPLGSEAVLEHHTNVEPQCETAANRLACENWDAPIVITTSVQFFESLFSNKPSRCRKLHNIADSVVILDEVQTLSAKLLAPIRHVLAELASNYGTTAVLCTATQPVLFDPAPKEIISDRALAFEVVANRCEVLMPESECTCPLG